MPTQAGRTLTAHDTELKSQMEEYEQDTDEALKELAKSSFVRQSSIQAAPMHRYPAPKITPRSTANSSCLPGNSPTTSTPTTAKSSMVTSKLTSKSGTSSGTSKRLQLRVHRLCNKILRFAVRASCLSWSRKQNLKATSVAGS